MTKAYDELTGKALKRVNKAKQLVEKHLFNFEGNQEAINWITRSPGFLDFRGYDPISKTFVDGGFYYKKRGRIKNYVATFDYPGNAVPDLLFGIGLKGKGFNKHVKAVDKESDLADKIIIEHQGDWDMAAYELAHWLDDLPGAKSKGDTSTYVNFEGSGTTYA